ncbi:MAG: hypothetical protein GY777_28390 [Candidatus Brocadiaceae bacterium]|nr:hypothetical protein [Candidatus Brocadiaceae bacterium]
MLVFLLFSATVHAYLTDRGSFAYEDGMGPVVGTGGVIADGSEMGHLFYGELGGTESNPVSTSVDSDLRLFSNLQDALYWSGTDTGFSPS